MEFLLSYTRAMQFMYMTQEEQMVEPGVMLEMVG